MGSLRLGVCGSAPWQNYQPGSLQSFTHDFGGGSGVFTRMKGRVTWTHSSWPARPPALIAPPGTSDLATSLSLDLGPVTGHRPPLGASHWGRRRLLRYKTQTSLAHGTTAFTVF